MTMLIKLFKGIVCLDPLHQFTPHRDSLTPKACRPDRVDSREPYGNDSLVSHQPACIDILLDKEREALTNTLPFYAVRCYG